MSVGSRPLITVSIALCVSAASQACAATPGTPPGWATYVNTRYDYDVCTPPALMPQGESPARDGQVFAAKDGATLTMSARPGAPQASVAHAADQEAAAMLSAAPIAYRAGRADWATRSGTDGKQTFYLKVIRTPDTLLFMDFLYPNAASAQYKPMIGALVSCFESSRPRD